jgi:hypothetical protein
VALVEVSEVQRGWRTLDTGEQADAQLLIDAAVAWIRDPTRCPDIADDNPIAKRVVIEVVRSAMSVPGEFHGHTSYTDTMGPWSQGGTLATPAGTLLFTAAHAAMLGIPSHPVMPTGDFGDPPEYRYPPSCPVMP